MLNHLILNVLDTFNVFYLWTVFEKKSYGIIKFIIGTIIASVLMTVTESNGISFLVTYIITIMVYRIFFEKDLKVIILGYFFIIFILMILQLALFMIIDKFIFDDTTKGMIIEVIITVGIIIYSKMNISKKISYSKIDNNVLIYFISTISVYVIICKLMWSYDKNIIFDNLLLIVSTLSILTISQIVIYLYIVKGIKEREELRLANEYSNVINEIVQEIKQRQHDFVNYKNTIKGILEVVDEKEIKKAISDYMKDEELEDNHINDLVYTENVVIRSVVYNNLVRAKKINANLKYTIENRVLDDILSYHEISNLLNNLLNNAFDEIMKEECINKNIEINIFKEKEISHLIVKNQIANNNEINLNEIFKRGYSTKDENIRGYGLYNVQQIVNANKGYIKLNVEGGKIIFDIYFNNSSGKSGSPKKV